MPVASDGSPLGQNHSGVESSDAPATGSGGGAGGEERSYGARGTVGYSVGYAERDGSLVGSNRGYAGSPDAVAA